MQAPELDHLQTQRCSAVKAMAPSVDAEVALINAHGLQMHNGVLECRWTATKGRVLTATRAFEPGELILEESPLHIVQSERRCKAFRRLEALCKEHENEFDYEPLWYWCALRSLTQEQLAGAREGGWAPVSAETQQALLLLHHEEESLESSPGSSARILVRELVPAMDPSVLDTLTQVWVLNCFDYTDEPQGYCTYFFSSFMSHSCLPNAFWHYAGNNHALRARSAIAAGDEVCISYLSEDWLLRSGPERRWDLHETKYFWCACERCNGKLDLSRGFLCPACRAGTVFAPAPGSGPARAQLPVQGDLAGVSCGACGHSLSREEAEKLGKYEGALKTLVDAFTESADAAAAQEIEDFVDAAFVQHWLADLAWEQLADFYGARKRRAEQRQALRRRCAFHAKAYPGLSGAHAWALEACGDALRPPRARKPPAPRPDLEEALGHYEEAHRILGLLYGSGQEYVMELERKHTEVMQALTEREGDGSNPGPDSGPIRSVKSRRFRGKQPPAACS